jgi:hypothetical protein
MLMLKAYMDETGHSQDQRSRFNGMAGLITKEENWLVYEREWGKILKHFKIPYIHMTESMEMFAGWSDAKVKDLSRCVWEIIIGIEALPLGSIVPMDDYRAIETQLKPYVLDPYYLTMQDCMHLALVFVTGGPFDSGVNPRVAIVFSDQAEFRYEGMQMFEAAIKYSKDLKKDLVDAPAFRDMKLLTPLQAADVVAYEIYKEYDRIYYQRNRPPRYGYERLEEIFENFKSPWIGNIELVMRHNHYTLNDLLARHQSADRIEDYWRKKRAVKAN